MKALRHLVALAIVIAAAVVAASAHPIDTTTTHAFEVASVKPSDEANASPLGPIPQVLPSPRGLTMRNLPLRLLVRLSYQIEDFQVVGGPDWQTSKRFDLTAKAPDSFSGQFKDMFPMLRALLNERFSLKTHVEQRELPIFSLVLAHNDRTLGPDMAASKDDCSDPEATQKRIQQLQTGGQASALAFLQQPNGVPCMMLPAAQPASPGPLVMRGRGQPMQALTALLQQLTGRAVRDKTGLMGLYDWKLTIGAENFARLASQSGVTLPAGLPPPPDGPSLMTTLREQLGLKLESDKGPVDVLVIDDASMPTPD